MKRVRIEDALIEMIDWCDFFPKGVWSRRAKVNYLIEIGLAVLLLEFEREWKEREGEDPMVDYATEIIQNQAANHLIIIANETKVPRSELARLVNRALFEYDNNE